MTTVCPDTARCSCHGDPHCNTYDDAMFDYQGICKYVMSNVSDSAPAALKRFTIWSRNEQRDGETAVAYVRYVEIELNGHTVRLARSSFQQLIVAVDVTVSTYNTRYIARGNIQ